MSKDTLQLSTVLIELDCLLDTRLAIVSQKDPVLLDKLLQKGSGYHERLSDPLQELYVDRDRSVLEAALITPMGQFLKEFSYCTLKQILNTPFHYQPKILLNVHPYNLTTDEENILIQSLRAVTHNKADIEIINVSYEQITPKFVKKHIAIMVLYRYDLWLETHSLNGKLKETTCPEVTLIGPAIYFKSYAMQADHQAAFDAIMKVAEPVIGLRLLPIENFSIVLKPS